MLIGNHYLSPDTKAEVITDYFHHFENTQNTNNTRLFNAPGSKWENGTPLLKCHYYSKLKGDAIYTSTCLLGPRQCVEAVDSLNMPPSIYCRG
jgi:hypothetical protein